MDRQQHCIKVEHDSIWRVGHNNEVVKITIPKQHLQYRNMFVFRHENIFYDQPKQPFFLLFHVTIIAIVVIVIAIVLLGFFVKMKQVCFNLYNNAFKLANTLISAELFESCQ